MTPFPVKYSLAAASFGLALLALPVSAADLLSGEWRGTYTCYQGVTNLALVLEPDGEAWSGIFMFGPLETNPTVPYGAYKVTVTEASGVYTMLPGDWVEQPDGYVAIGGSGTMSEDMMQLSGTLDFEGCDTFKATRISEPPALKGKKK